MSSNSLLQVAERPVPCPGWLRGVVGGLLAAAVLLGALTMLQDHLLYFPARASVAEMGRTGLSPWPAPDNFRGLLAEPAGAVRGTAIVFHGNAGHAGQRAYYAEALLPLGLRVILAEYPGYGPRDGALGESSLVADAAASIEAAHRQFGAPLIVIGESLGAGVAAAAVAQQSGRVAGVLLITPWDRLENVASFHYPWLPVRWLLRDRYDSAAHLADFGAAGAGGGGRARQHRAGALRPRAVRRAAAAQAAGVDRSGRAQRLAAARGQQVVAAGAGLSAAATCEQSDSSATLRVDACRT